MLSLDPLSYFTDPILRGPTIGCMLMCLGAALVGVIVFLRKQSLVGESLSHASYPGVICGVMIAGIFDIVETDEGLLTVFIMSGAFFSSLLGLWIIYLLEGKWKIRSDSALCFVLSSFFGIGITLASHIQFTYPALYRQVQVYLYGQAATMTDIHIVIYGLFSLIIIIIVAFLYKELLVITFDRNYAKSLGIQTIWIDTIVFVLIVFAVVVGIRSVGVVLMSAMLIAPAAAARQFTNKLYLMLFFSGVFGVISGYLGNYFSVQFTDYLAFLYPNVRLALPTGPMIVVVASSICLFSLFFAPERGFLLRLVRIGKFRYQCVCENLLKSIWRFGAGQEVTFEKIAKYQSISSLYLHFILFRLGMNGWVERVGPHCYRLTTDGQQRAANIVRLHRLWEVYLVDYLGVGVERVHHNAEEMEHIITPELERELTLLLNDPKRDPHHQPIPPNPQTLL